MKSYLINKGVKSYISFMLVFAVIAIITIVTRVLEMDEIQNVFKPMLMPILMIFVYVNTKLSTSFSKLIFFALLFSLAGDVFLMPYFDIFIFGLASFLIAHIFYIVAFLKGNKLIEGIKKNMLFVVILLLAYLSLIFILVSNMLESNTDVTLIVAVVIYATVITVMVLSTMSMYGNDASLQSKLMMIGAIFFMFSDSVIAINKFIFEITYSGLLIMLTYTLAQWLITVGGILKIKSE
jgi:uncharacterized membrane protein YhhN